LKINKKHNGFAIVLSWPETRCKQAGGWYEPLLKFLKINKDGYYIVGHSAVVLISDRTGLCEYFDFGRYHAPFGFGRVRDQYTDHELRIKTEACINDSLQLTNGDEILEELYRNKSCHGSGYIFSSTVRADTDRALQEVKRMQEREFIPYGPLEWNGTNCSRFVARILNHSNIDFVKWLKLNFQLTLSSSPKGNVYAMNEQIRETGDRQTSNQLVLNEEKQWATI